MFRVKRFLSLIALVVGGLVGASSLTSFSVARCSGPLGACFDYRQFSFPMPNNPVYLYAVTEPNTYTVYFDGNGNNSGDMSGMNMTYDKTGVNLPENKFEKDGFIFAGWSTNKTGPVEFSDQEEVLNLTSVNNAEVTLYAQWTEGMEVPYMVEYYKENVGGTGYDVETGGQSGLSGTIGIANELYFTGFMYDSGNNLNVTTGVIDGEGNPVLRMYYIRRTYDLTIIHKDKVWVDTGVKYGADIPLPSDLEWTGNTFDGWYNLPEDGKMPANNLIITSKWIYGVHTITFDVDGGTEVAPITGNSGDVVYAPENNPTKTGYEFVGWDTEFPITIYGDDIIVKAIWKEVKGGGGRSGGGGRGGGGGGGGGDSSDESGGEQEHGSAMDQMPEGRGSLEEMMAYMWARSRGIIDTSRKDSDPDGYIPRGDMAEFVVKFTENVIGKKIPSEIPAHCNWGDAEREWKSPETKVYAQKACVLGVMGIRMQNFMPNKILDRAEFGTILSRLLWGDKYDVVDATATKLYYIRHLYALNREGVMTQTENPEARKELRKWAWLMLMRVESRILR